MRLVSFRGEDGLRAGVVLDGLVFCATGLLGGPNGSSPPMTAKQVLEGGPALRERLVGAAHTAEPELGSALDSVVLGPPVPDPDKIVCLGLNYRDHAEEAGLDLPVAPMLFAKFRNSLIGPEDSIVVPAVTERVDYEAELAVVVGRRATRIASEDALDHVAGVMAFNDVSARDLQLQTSQWTAGKALDTFAPCGPAIVSLDEIDDLQRLAVRTRVNGRTVQDGNTADMIFPVAETIAWLSSVMTLEPGDIIATGTPAGVGFKREPPVLLVHGDVVEVEIDGIGSLRNPVVNYQEH